MWQALPVTFLSMCKDVFFLFWASRINPRIKVLDHMHECWASHSSQNLIVTWLQTKPSPIHHNSTERPCQKESHRVYTLQDGYLGRTPITPLKNAMPNMTAFQGRVVYGIKLIPWIPRVEYWAPCKEQVGTVFLHGAGVCCMLLSRERGGFYTCLQLAFSVNVSYRKEDRLLYPMAISATPEEE